MSDEQRTDFGALIGNGEDLVLDETTLHIKPVGIKHFPDMLTVQSAFLSGMSQDMMDKQGKNQDMGIKEIKEILGGLDDKSKDAISRLVTASLTKSYPDQDEEELSIVGLKYGLPLIMHILKVNSAQTHEQTKKDKILTGLNAKTKPTDTK